jgi:hypothetical protein
LKAGKIGLSTVYAITRSPDQAAALAAKLNGTSRDDLERAIPRKAKAPAEKAGRIRIELVSGVTVTFAGGSGLTLDLAIEAAADAGKELRKGRDQGLTAKTISKVSAERAKGGANGRVAS